MISRLSSLDWDRDSHDWPHRESSGFVKVGRVSWFVQRMGRGPAVLLVHGTGASSHSWRDIASRLAEHFTVINFDLPGHGFSAHRRSHDLSLTGMSRAISDLLNELETEPVLGIGHSAGAAILVKMCLEGRIAPAGIAAINGAFLPFRGTSGIVFPVLAKLLFLNPLAPRLFASQANPRAVERLITETGSRIDPQGVALYRRLLRDPEHAAGALGMMAAWDLNGLERAMRRLPARLMLVVGDRDLAVPPDTARRIHSRMAESELVVLPGLGHLAHEEDPQQCADLLIEWAMQLGVIPAARALCA